MSDRPLPRGMSMAAVFAATVDHIAEVQAERSATPPPALFMEPTQKTSPEEGQR